MDHTCYKEILYLIKIRRAKVIVTLKLQTTPSICIAPDELKAIHNCREYPRFKIFSYASYVALKNSNLK